MSSRKKKVTILLLMPVMLLVFVIAAWFSSLGLVLACGYMELRDWQVDECSGSLQSGIVLKGLGQKTDLTEFRLALFEVSYPALTTQQIPNEILIHQVRIEGLRHVSQRIKFLNWQEARLSLIKQLRSLSKPEGGKLLRVKNIELRDVMIQASRAHPALEIEHFTIKDFVSTPEGLKWSELHLKSNMAEVRILRDDKGHYQIGVEALLTAESFVDMESDVELSWYGDLSDALPNAGAGEQALLVAFIKYLQSVLI